MEIISLSVDEETERKIDEIDNFGSFRGRSEMVRTAIEKLYRDKVAMKGLEGHVNAVIVVRHPHSKEENISEISHDFDKVINTQLHSKLERERCLEIFHVEGDAAKVLEMFRTLEGSRNTDSVTIIPQT